MPSWQRRADVRLRPCRVDAESAPRPWTERAAAAHAVLLRDFRNATPLQGWPGLFRQRVPAGLADRIRVRYWWQAQTLDALIDAQQRTPSAAGLERVRALIRGLRMANGGRITNQYYDDMAWMGLALVRADALGVASSALVGRLWREIERAWNPVHGGGIPWRRSQRDYKNVPANAPAALLAARLGQTAWARRTVDWIERTLVDPATGIVWDGIGRRGDSAIDRDWIFTYTGGVLAAAEHELGRRAQALRTAHALIDRLAPDGVLPDEGPGDAALFKGIAVRHLAALHDPRVDDVLRRSAEAAWRARDGAGRFGSSWKQPPRGPVELSAHLSGVMLLERLAAREHA